jgi:hypothetical protein
VRQMGDRLSDAWEKKWHASGIEGKWEDIVREQKADEVRAVFSPWPAPLSAAVEWASSHCLKTVVAGAHGLCVSTEVVKHAHCCAGA